MCAVALLHHVNSRALSCPAVPIISFSLEVFDVVEGASAEIVIIRSGDPGIEVSVILEAVELLGAANGATCTLASLYVMC